jgi:hypothetical protein
METFLADYGIEVGDLNAETAKAMDQDSDGTKCKYAPTSEEFSVTGKKTPWLWGICEPMDDATLEAAMGEGK